LQDRFVNREYGRCILADLAFKFAVQSSNIGKGLFARSFKSRQFGSHLFRLQSYTIWSNEDLVNTVRRTDRNSR